MAKEFKQSAYSVTYWRMRPSWLIYLALYEPLPVSTSATRQSGVPELSTLGQFLFKYKSEDNEEFASRLNRVCQVNMVEYVCEYWISMLFSSPPMVESSDFQDEVKAFWDNCNGRGDSLVDYAREVICPSSFLYGVSDVVCDMPKKDNSVISLQDEENADSNVYCYMIPPLNRMDWELNRYGEYTRYRSFDVINTQITAGMGVKDQLQYQEWTPEEVTSYDTSGKVVGEPEVNPYGFIPIVPVLYRNSMRFFSDAIGISLVKDVAPIQRLIINLISLIMDTQENSNFAMRYFIQDISENYDPEADAPTEGEAGEVGAKRWFKARGKDSKIGILQPDPAGADNMQRLLGQMIDLLFLSCGLPTDIGQNKTHQTGDTVRANYSKILNRVANMAKQFGKALKRITQNALMVRGHTPQEVIDANIQVTWNTNYSFQSFLETMEELSALKNICGNELPSAYKAMVKQSLSPKIYTSEEYPEFLKEVEALGVDTIEALPAHPIIVPDPIIAKQVSNQEPTI